MSELRGLGAINDELEKVGGQVLALSVDAPDRSKRDVVRKHKLEFDVLSDPDREVITRYGLMHTDAGMSGDIAVPANILVDRDGRIVWRYTPNRIQERLDPADVMTEVQRLIDRG